LETIMIHFPSLLRASPWLYTTVVALAKASDIERAFCGGETPAYCHECTDPIPASYQAKCNDSGHCEVVR